MDVNIKELLESGVYFGHPTRQFDPRIKPFLYGKRQGIYIINIEKSLEKIKEAGGFLKKIAAANKTILFVGTKRQAQAAIKETAKKCEMPYVNYRWIGGTLTNFNEIQKRIARLEEIEELEKSGKLSVYTKKESSLILKEKEELIKKFGGIREINGYPEVIVVVDIRKEINVIREAKKVGTKIVGVVDTNSNPEMVDYPIPANDDGLKSISLILSKLAESILEARAEMKYVPEEISEEKKFEEGESEKKPSDKAEKAKQKDKETGEPKKEKEIKSETEKNSVKAQEETTEKENVNEG